MIYIDELLIYNFLIDYILLSTLSYILKLNTKNRRIILSSLIGEICLISLFYSFNNFILIIIKILTCIIMLIVSFGYNDIKSVIKNYIYYNILNFFLGGFLFYIKSEQVFSYKYFIILVPIIMNIYKYFTYNLKYIFSLRHKVTIYLNDGRVLYLNGYLDSGNNLIEPYFNRKVIIINKKINENFYLVPYKTIGCESLIKCFNPKKVFIDGIGERNDISVGIVDKKFNGYNCLLNYKIMEDIC